MSFLEDGDIFIFSFGQRKISFVKSSEGAYPFLEYQQGMFLSYYLERGTFGNVIRTRIIDVFIEKGTDVQPDVGTSFQQFDTLQIEEGFKG